MTIKGTFQHAEINFRVLVAMMASEMTGCPPYIVEDPRRTEQRFLAVRKKMQAFLARLREEQRLQARIDETLDRHDRDTAALNQAIEIGQAKVKIRRVQGPGAGGEWLNLGQVAGFSIKADAAAKYKEK